MLLSQNLTMRASDVASLLEPLRVVQAPGQDAVGMIKRSIFDLYKNGVPSVLIRISSMRRS